MYKFGILGVGKMGSSILNGILEANIFKKEDILLNLHSDEEVEYYGNKLGFKYVRGAKDLFENSKLILLAIKPQVFPEIEDTAKSLDFKGKGIISICAGITLDYLDKLFKGAEIVRIMPNTPALIKMAVATICSINTKTETYKLAFEIFNSIGKCYEIDEKFMDATIPLNGSMPAYLELFAKAFIDKAVLDGIDPEVAKKLVCESIISSANLILKSDEPIETLIKNVCSKGGTTLAGLDKLYENDFEKAIHECSEACKNRSAELKR